MKLKPPIVWVGGKELLARHILPLLPGHRTYVEPFGGSAALLFAKPPSPVEVYNDIDSDVVNFFRVLRDDEKFARFYRLVSLTPYSREEYYDLRSRVHEITDDVERAHAFFVGVMQSFAGHIWHSWGFSVTWSSRGMAGECASLLSSIEGLPRVHARLMRVQIEHDDFRKVLTTYDTPDTLFYCDPPYVIATRRGGEYSHEMSDDDHADLVAHLLQLKGKVILSGYQHEIYTPLEDAGWRRLDFEVACNAVGRTRGTGLLGDGAVKREQMRTESVWLSPNCERQARLWG